MFKITYCGDLSQKHIKIKVIVGQSIILENFLYLG
jgi:hypothetical protein